MKLIAVLVLVMIVFTLFFGCTVTDDTNGAPKVTTQAEANQSINDASTDLSGVKQTLDDIENDLTQ